MEEEKDEIPPFLANLKKTRDKSGVPENYFADFEMNLRKRVMSEKSTLKTAPPLKFKSFYVFTAAASVLLLIMFALWYLRADVSSNPFDYQKIMATNIEDALKKVHTREADDFIIAAIDEIETDELEEMIEDKDILALEQISVFESDSLRPDSKKSEIILNEKKLPEKKENLNRFTDLDELDDDIADDTALDDLFNDLGDDELLKLEKSLLKPKTETKPKPN